MTLPHPAPLVNLQHMSMLISCMQRSSGCGTVSKIAKQRAFDLLDRGHYNVSCQAPQGTNEASVPYLTVKVDECIAAAAADSSVLSCRWTVCIRWHRGHNGSQRDPQAAGGVALIEHLLAHIGL